jgi:hypothetical protein
MPCYEVRLVSVEFKAAHRDLLLQALDELGWGHREEGRTIYVSGGLEISLDGQQVRCPKGMQSRVNAIKQKYSEVVLKKVAAKKKWSVKAKGQNKFTLKKWA